MHGFFKLSSNILTLDEHKIYKSYYCRLCSNLYLNYGSRARLLTSYDVIVFMMIVSLKQSNDNCYFVCSEKKSCTIINRKKLKCFKYDALGKSFATCCLLTLREGIRDKIIDEGSKLAYLLACFYNKSIKKSEKLFPQAAELAVEKMNDIINIEKSKQIAVAGLWDIYGSYFSEMLLLWFPTLDGQYLELAKNFAAWMYFLDMLIDYEKDAKTAQFNPLVRKDCPTFQLYFDKYWHEIDEYKKRLLNRIVLNINSIKTTKQEWFILLKIIRYNLPDNILNALNGKSGIKKIVRSRSMASRLGEK